MKRSNTGSIIPALAAAGAVALPYAAPAYSQRDVAVSGLEEIVVTARKREENLADVPLAISAFSDAFIERSGIESVADLATQTPGFTMHQGFGRTGAGQGGGSSNRPTIRGQSNILGVPNVGFFVDGIYVSGNVTAYQLDNLERVEVIRGPQSAIFGRGTFSGAVNFITREPDDELRGKVEATLGQYDHRALSGYVSGPLKPGVLAAELNGRYYEFGGDWLNRATGKRDGGAQRTVSAGAKLRFTPTEDFTLTFAAQRAEDTDGPFAASYSGTNCLEPTIIRPGTVPVSSTRRTGYYCGEVKSESSFFSRHDILEAAGFEGVDRDTTRFSLQMDYEFAGGWSTSATAAYNEFRNQNASDRTFEQGEPILRPTGLTAGQDSREDWSAELRIESPQDRRVRGLLGAYQYQEDDGDGYRVTFALPAGTVPLGVVDTVRTTRTPEINDSGVRNWSVFGLVEFDVNDRFSVTAEGRYQVDKIISDQLPLISGNALLQNSFSKFLPRGTALFRINDQWNAYGNIARGNKPGGFNALPDDANAESAAALQRFQVFEEESAWTYELGIKGTNESRSISVNAALFHIDWEKQQLTRTESYTRLNGTTFARSLIQNAGASTIQGLELEASFQPRDWVNLRLAYAWVNAEIRDFVDEVQEDLFDTDGRVGRFNPGNDPGGQTRGNQLPQTPLHQIIFSTDFNGALTPNWNWSARTDFTYESRRYAQVHNLAYAGDSNLLNLRFGLERDKLALTFFVSNALDDRTPAVVSRFVDFTRSIAIPSNINPAVTQTVTRRDMQVAHPRKQAVGITVAYRF
jgi:outer membrane receptor protein involved in Fe transport